MTEETVVSLWEVVNSPLVLTFTSLLLGGWLLTAISKLWQERAARKQLQIEQLRETLETYHLYVRVLRAGGANLAGEEWSRLHAKLQALAKINAVLFRDEEAASGWNWIAQALATQRDLVLKSGEGVDREAFAPIRERAHAAQRAMVEEIV